MKGGGGGGELQRRLPEGVKLRNKKKKPSKRTAVQRGLKLQSQQDLSGLTLKNRFSNRPRNKSMYLLVIKHFNTSSHDIT